MPRLIQLIKNWYLLALKMASWLQYGEWYPRYAPTFILSLFIYPLYSLLLFPLYCQYRRGNSVHPYWYLYNQKREPNNYFMSWYTMVNIFLSFYLSPSIYLQTNMVLIRAIYSPSSLGINVDVIHSDRSPAQRIKTVRSTEWVVITYPYKKLGSTVFYSLSHIHLIQVDKFRTGDIWVLITTDLMARGIDFKGKIEFLSRMIIENPFNWYSLSSISLFL